MDLIDRASLIASMGLENAVKWGNKDGYQQAHSYSTMMLYEIKYDIDAQPTIEAVPLDKLCRMLAKYIGFPCNYSPIDEEMADYCGDQCEMDDIGCWENVLSKWMEGQHET